MNARRQFRPNRKAPAERAKEHELRARLQKERPSLEDLIRRGECDPNDVMTMAEYFALVKQAGHRKP